MSSNEEHKEKHKSEDTQSVGGSVQPIERKGSVQSTDSAANASPAADASTSSDAYAVTILNTSIIARCGLPYDLLADIEPFVSRVTTWKVYDGVPVSDDGSVVADFSAQPSQVVTPVADAQGYAFNPVAPGDASRYNSVLAGYDAQQTLITSAPFSLQTTC